MNHIKIPSIYKHFKGRRYVTIGISKPVVSIAVSQKVCSVLHTELDTHLGVIEYCGSYYHHDSVDKEMLVIYKPIDLNNVIYARPLKMFISEVDKKKYPHIKQKI